MNYKTVIDILKQNNISVKKKYGQNFLLDEKILHNISTVLDKEEMKNVIEIGPGLGFLTNELSKVADKVVSYEIDEEMVDFLQTKTMDNVLIKQQDILKVNINQEINDLFNNQPVSLIANLPYYITTPILTKLLEETTLINNYVVMMQKEVADRLCGKPSTKDYNALSVFIQYYTDAKIALFVPPSSFYPEPEVESAVVWLKRKEDIVNKASDEKSFIRFIKGIFTQRRKTLLNNTSTYLQIPKDIVQSALIKNSHSLTIRAEALSVKELVDLFNDIYLNYSF